MAAGTTNAAASAKRAWPSGPLASTPWPWDNSRCTEIVFCASVTGIDCTAKRKLAPSPRRCREGLRNSLTQLICASARDWPNVMTPLPTNSSWFSHWTPERSTTDLVTERVWTKLEMTSRLAPLSTTPPWPSGPRSSPGTILAWRTLALYSACRFFFMALSSSLTAWEEFLACWSNARLAP